MMHIDCVDLEVTRLQTMHSLNAVLSDHRVEVEHACLQMFTGQEGLCCGRAFFDALASVLLVH
jgi:hypothetical protein